MFNIVWKDRYICIFGSTPIPTPAPAARVVAAAAASPAILVLSFMLLVGPIGPPWYNCCLPIGGVRSSQVAFENVRYGVASQ